jgi:tetratricopeptide (TPR) repeat protein
MPEADLAKQPKRTFARIRLTKGRAVWLIVILLAATTLAVYWPLLRCDFTRYDDDQYVTENLNVRQGLTWKGVLWAFNAGYAGNWHPLTWLSHMLDVEIFGLRPAGHHGVNIILHVVNVLLLFFVLKRMTGRLWESAFVAALFAVHPLHVESVAWIAERKDVLSTVFWMLAMLAYAAYAESPSRSRNAAVIGLFAVGLTAKPMLVTLPFVFLLLDYWPLGRFRAGGTKTGHWPGWRLIWEKAPLFVLAAISCLVTYIAQWRGGAVSPDEWIPLSVRAANALVSYGRYLLLAFHPTKLAVLYPHPGASLPVWQPVVAGAALAGMTYLVLRAGRKRSYLAVGWFWYLGTLVPVIGLVQVGAQAMADRYTYVPFVGLFIAVAWAFGDFLGTRKATGTGKSAQPVLPIRPWSRSFIVAVFAGALIVILALLARAQMGVWRSTETLFRNAVKVTKNNSIAHNHLGETLVRKGNVDEAVIHLRAALQIDPRYAYAHFNLAHVLSLQGKLGEAIQHYRQGLDLRPGDFAALSELGVAYSKLGRWEDAVGSFQQALRIRPDDPDTCYQLAVAMLGHRDFAGAADQLSVVLKHNPDWPDAHHNLSVALLQLGRIEEAIRQAQAALELRPDYGLAHRQLAAALYIKGDYPGAWREVRLARQYGSPPSSQFLQQLSAKMPEHD